MAEELNKENNEEVIKNIAEDASAEDIATDNTLTKADNTNDDTEVKAVVEDDSECTDDVTAESDDVKEVKMSYADAKESYEADADVLDELTTGVNYEKSKEKYQENISTGITFLLFGIAGIVVVALNIVGVLKFFSLRNAGGILMTVVIGGMFLIFTVIGILSFVAAGRNKKNVKLESDNSIMVLDWLEANVTSEDIDNSYDSSAIADEMKYFERSDYLKARISEQFPELNEEFIESLIEQYIEKIF